MFSADDKMLLVLHSCYDGLATERLPYYIYMLQKIGVDFNFRYRLGASKFASKGLNEYLNILMNEGLLRVRGSFLEPTNAGREKYFDLALTYDEWELLDWAKAVFDSLTDTELYFVCLTEMIVDEAFQRGGYQELIRGETAIKDALKGLSHDYSEENFNSAIHLSRVLKRQISL